MYVFCYSDQIKEAWDIKKGVHENMQSMGLSKDVNQTMSIPKARVLSSTAS